MAPTYVITPAMQAKIDAGERDPEVLRNSGALDLLVEPEHIGEAVAFLCSERQARSQVSCFLLTRALMRLFPYGT
ncbi:MAG: hypothetical protein CM1200mP41_12000 [Gammaproteobacteria bacterium]|nr:MAG: hypothetical protein CM1200mP41_12000 [Gammaproteobacteria bacterium]